MSYFYLIDEFPHFSDSWGSLLEALEVVRGENEVSFLPLWKELVPLLPKESLLDGGWGPLLLKEKKWHWISSYLLHGWNRFRFGCFWVRQAVHRCLWYIKSPLLKEIYLQFIHFLFLPKQPLKQNLDGLV